MSRQSIRAAVLVIRLWNEETSAPALRARILESPDVMLEETHSSVAVTVDEICAIVKVWAERFASPEDFVRR